MSSSDISPEKLAKTPYGTVSLQIAARPLHAATNGHER